jgi:hypothetical protein
MSNWVDISSADGLGGDGGDVCDATDGSNPYCKGLVMQYDNITYIAPVTYLILCITPGTYLKLTYVVLLSAYPNNYHDTNVNHDNRLDSWWSTCHQYNWIT